MLRQFRILIHYGSFTLMESDSGTDSDSDSDTKPDGYIVLYRTVHIAQTQIWIPTPHLCKGQESESVCGHVNEPLKLVHTKQCSSFYVVLPLKAYSHTRRKWVWKWKKLKDKQQTSKYIFDFTSPFCSMWMNLKIANFKREFLRLKISRFPKDFYIICKFYCSYDELRAAGRRLLL